MWKILLLLVLLAVSSWGQTASVQQYTPTVIGVTVGSYYCIFWFGTGVARAPWHFEAACYDPGGSNTYIQVGTNTMNNIVGSVNTPNGAITYELKANGTGYDYILVGQGTADTMPIQVTGSF